MSSAFSKCGSDLPGCFTECRFVVNEIEECTGHGCGSGIASGDDEKIAFSPQFVGGETTSCFGISCLEQPIEEVFAIGVRAYFGPLHSLGFAVLHILCTLSCDLMEEYPIEVPIMDGQVCAALSEFVSKSLSGQTRRNFYSQ